MKCVLCGSGDAAGLSAIVPNITFPAISSNELYFLPSVSLRTLRMHRCVPLLYYVNPISPGTKKRNEINSFSPSD